MKLFDDYRLLEALPEHVGRVVTIGNFDGVHLGHRAVLASGKRRAVAEGLQLAVLTFEPHPVQFFFPNTVVKRLTNLTRKCELLEDAGADVVLAQRFGEEIAGMDATVFCRGVLAEALRARVVIVGENFRFGKGRHGDIRALQEAGASHGFEVAGLPLTDLDGERVSSSRIRASLLAGNVGKATELLGRAYEVRGTVSHGRGEGRGLGFPTVNLDAVETMLPAPGIYAGWCQVDGTSHRAAIYCGNRQTLGHGDALEAHLLDFSKDVYGRKVTLRFVHRLREDRKFNAVDQLVSQIRADVARVTEILEASDA